MNAPITRAELLTQLARCVPVEAILSETEDMRPFETDGLTAYRQTPYVVVLPSTEAQVQAIQNFWGLIKTSANQAKSIKIGIRA